MPDSDNLEYYDPRRVTGRNLGRQRKEKEARSRFRDRSRSRSPEVSSPKSEGIEDLEATRRARMARLRAEMEEEEAKLTQRTVEPVIPSAKDAIVQVDESKLEGLDEEEQMKLLLGFSGEFGTTKNQKVEDNHKSAAKGAAAKHKERKYRQYMNRKNGFNRPLDKMD